MPTVPILQSSGQVVAFMSQYLDLPIPSPALFDQIGLKIRRSVASFAEANHIPWVRFGKDAGNAEVMAPYLNQAAATGRSQVAEIGVAQEFQRVCRSQIFCNVAGSSQAAKPLDSSVKVIPALRA
jgi:hypothetical protein